MTTKQEARIQWLYREIRKNIIIKGDGNLNENDEEIQKLGRTNNTRKIGDRGNEKYLQIQSK